VAPLLEIKNARLKGYAVEDGVERRGGSPTSRR